MATNDDPRDRDLSAEITTQLAEEMLERRRFEEGHESNRLVRSRTNLELNAMAELRAQGETFFDEGMPREWPEADRARYVTLLSERLAAWEEAGFPSIELSPAAAVRLAADERRARGETVDADAEANPDAGGDAGGDE